ncbi:MAG: hypothetical protein Q8O65_03650, partial [Nitrosopumilaceae archaeon]|nr:hypothetical protein [Nitrosopumilaceae archaeon]
MIRNRLTCYSILILVFFISLYVIKEASADSHELTATPLGQYSVRLEWIEPSKIPDEKSIIDYEIRYK